MSSGAGAEEVKKTERPPADTYYGMKGGFVLNTERVLLVDGSLLFDDMFTFGLQYGKIKKKEKHYEFGYEVEGITSFGIWDDEFTFTNTYDVDSSFKSLGGYGVGRLKFGVFNLKAKAGLVYYDSKYRIKLSGVTVYNDDEQGFVQSIGAGFGFRFADVVGIEYEWVMVNDNHVISQFGVHLLF